MRNLTFRIIMTLVIVFLSSAVLALSCNDAAKKLADQLKNNNGDGSGDKNLVDPSLKITLIATNTIAKMDASGNIKINAKTLADRMDNATGYAARLIAITNLVTLFNDDKRALPLFEVQLMRNSSTVAEGGFVVGGRTNGGGLKFTKSDLAFENTADSLSHADRTTSVEDEVWRRSDTTGNFYQLISYSAVFSVSSLDNSIYGWVVCPTGKMNGVTSGATAQDNTKLPFTKITCYLIQTLSTSTSSIYELNEAWIDDRNATKKRGVGYIGVYTGDAGLKDLSSAAGWTKASFFDALDNAAMQKIFDKNKYVEKTFNIELLKDVDFKK